MLYKNTKTGVLYDSPCVISGGDWVLLDESQEDTDITPDDVTSDDVIDSEDDIQLSKMTIKDLKALAVELEIDLGDATKKDDIINVILAAEESEEEE